MCLLVLPGLLPTLFNVEEVVFHKLSYPDLMRDWFDGVKNPSSKKSKVSVRLDDGEPPLCAGARE